MMNKLFSAIALGACLSFGAAHAANKAPTAQNNRMTACNKEAGDAKGDERKAFMKKCLSTKRTASRERMKTCNADPKAKELKGDERKAFMKECLTAKPA
jgi:hypothetical protein